MAGSGLSTSHNILMREESLRDDFNFYQESAEERLVILGIAEGENPPAGKRVVPKDRHLAGGGLKGQKNELILLIGHKNPFTPSPAFFMKCSTI